MNKNKMFWLTPLLAGFLMAGCATPKNADKSAKVAVDACKLMSPPKDSYTQDAGHMGQSFTYPYALNVPDNYSGCMKSWIGDYDIPPKSYFLVLSTQFKDGRAVQVEGYEPTDENHHVQLVLTCKFNHDGNLISGPKDECADYSDFTIKSSKKIILETSKR